MIYRFMYVGYTQNPQSIKITGGDKNYVALSYKDGQAFMYVESNEPEIDPDLMADGELTPYPTGKKWDRASEVYHYSVPMNEEQWCRKIADKTNFIRVNYLKPDMVASYVCYHYLLQEENPTGGIRYGIIFVHGSQLVQYEELPQEEETIHLPGSLTTKSTPPNMAALMEQHFLSRWTETENLDKSAYIKF